MELIYYSVLSSTPSPRSLPPVRYISLIDDDDVDTGSNRLLGNRGVVARKRHTKEPH